MVWRITGVGAALSLLDIYSNATAAFSLRSLSLSYGGPVVKVRRSSDNTEQDFTFSQVTDGTLTAFCGAGNGFVRTWYDQSGNARHATQTINANQPQIVNSGSLILESGKPALQFNGSSHRLDFPVTAFSMNALSVAIVCRLSGSSGIFFSSPDPNRVYVPFCTSSTFYVGYEGSAIAFNFGSSNATSRYLWQLSAGVSTVNSWRNGIASSSIASSSAAVAGDFISIGSYRNSLAESSYWTGTSQELIIYRFDQTSNQAGIAANINAHYSIY